MDGNPSYRLKSSVDTVIKSIMNSNLRGLRTSYHWLNYLIMVTTIFQKDSELLCPLDNPLGLLLFAIVLATVTGK